MTGVFKELVFGLGRGFGIYFSQRNEFIDSVMTPGQLLKKRR
jgi:putative component of toxin-antitoxin plasmid stabilization module